VHSVGPRRLLAAPALALALAISPPAARALPNGITGYSGKQNQTCNQCHVGGTAPDVSFVGPDTLATNEVGTFQFVVTSNNPPVQDGAGFNVAAQAGTLAIIAGEGERRAGDGELTHTEPKQNEAGIAMWSFTWKAPTQPGTYRLFGAGNSVNQNGQSSGDRARTTRFDVQVVAAAATSTPTASPSPTATVPPPSATATAMATSPPDTATATATLTQTAPPTAMATATPSATVTIQASTATALPSHTATAESTSTPVDTASATASATHSATAVASPTPTPTRIPIGCAGDCNGDGRVSINELVTGVGIALGTSPLASCTALDRDDNGRVTIAELVATVNSALNCPGI
jgi:hypothetical protein